MLIQRRDKIGHAYLNAINPVVNVALDGSGALTFDNAAVAAGVAEAPAGGYVVHWSRFDNNTGTATDDRHVDSRRERPHAGAGVAADGARLPTSRSRSAPFSRSTRPGACRSALSSAAPPDGASSGSSACRRARGFPSRTRGSGLSRKSCATGFSRKIASRTGSSA